MFATFAGIERGGGIRIMEPFGLSEVMDADEIKAIRKRELSNLLTSYADEADVFSELIQNAFDAVNLAITRGQYEGDNIPRLDVFIGRRDSDEHYFAVVDNGVGMPPDVAARFTIPGWGFGKERGKTVGHKGIGASFVVAATNRFALTTRSDGERSEMTISGAYTWIRNMTAPSPSVTEKADLPDAVRAAIPDRGTAACVYFHDGMRPSKLSWVVSLSNDSSEEVANWASYLCLKTSLGQATDPKFKDFLVRFHLDRGGGDVTSFDWRFGPAFSRNLRVLAYPFPNNVLSVAEPIAAIQKIPDTHKHLHRNRYQALTLDLTKEEIEEIDLSDEEKEVVREHVEGAHLYYTYSVKLIDEIRKKLGTTQFKHGIKLIVDNVPQGRMVDFSLTRNQGLDRQMHATISFKGLELDSGRKIPSNEHVASAIRKIGGFLANRASDYKFFMRKKELPEKPANLTKWREEVTERRKDSLVRLLFDHVGSEPPIHADPFSETDVIALTAGLATAGLLKGLRLFSLSSSAMYDCLADIVCSDQGVRLDSDPLSVRTLSHSREQDLGVVEFKFVFASLIDDFLNEVKKASDIHLLICWDVGSLNVARGRLDYWYGPKADRREVYGATHVWTDDNLDTTIPVISLKHVVAILLADFEAKSGQPSLGTAKLDDLRAQDDADLL